MFIQLAVIENGCSYKSTTLNKHFPFGQRRFAEQLAIPWRCGSNSLIYACGQIKDCLVHIYLFRKDLNSFIRPAIKGPNLRAKISNCLCCEYLRLAVCLF